MSSVTLAPFLVSRKLFSCIARERTNNTVELGGEGRLFPSGHSLRSPNSTVSKQFPPAETGP